MVDLIRHLKVIEKLLLLDGPDGVAVDSDHNTEAEDCNQPILSAEKSMK